MTEQNQKRKSIHTLNNDNGENSITLNFQQQFQNQFNNSNNQGDQDKFNLTLVKLLENTDLTGEFGINFYNSNQQAHLQDTNLQSHSFKIEKQTSKIQQNNIHNFKCDTSRQSLGTQDQESVFNYQYEQNQSSNNQFPKTELDKMRETYINLKEQFKEPLYKQHKGKNQVDTIEQNICKQIVKESYDFNLFPVIQFQSKKTKKQLEEANDNSKTFYCIETKMKRQLRNLKQQAKNTIKERAISLQTNKDLEKQKKHNSIYKSNVEEYLKQKAQKNQKDFQRLKQEQFEKANLGYLENLQGKRTDVYDLTQRKQIDEHLKYKKSFQMLKKVNPGIYDYQQLRSTGFKQFNNQMNKSKNSCFQESSKSGLAQSDQKNGNKIYRLKDQIGFSFSDNMNDNLQFIINSSSKKQDYTKNIYDNDQQNINMIQNLNQKNQNINQNSGRIMSSKSLNIFKYAQSQNVTNNSTQQNCKQTAMGKTFFKVKPFEYKGYQPKKKDSTELNISQDFENMVKDEEVYKKYKEFQKEYHQYKRSVRSLTQDIQKKENQFKNGYSNSKYVQKPGWNQDILKNKNQTLELYATQDLHNKGKFLKNLQKNDGGDEIFKKLSINKIDRPGTQQKLYDALKNSKKVNNLHFKGEQFDIEDYFQKLRENQINQPQEIQKQLMQLQKFKENDLLEENQQNILEYCQTLSETINNTNESDNIDIKNKNNCLQQQEQNQRFSKKIYRKKLHFQY
ncbi:hypothetical protein PPERSA_03208 [Pseudocohnilembus persalinus]|uniref:Uncharacterized protein n=1 Tax=Pseudocohnilembus persalinus TaxID=266149 RepID=A0A0V0QEC2_PSEPJ|nr:hypothetical protein PPERSA_03208 [Pseudocohnilembus persalinus]|eukprot:KRX00475.1 hypothetical protein PPERSA_03208 [Pseudocohnilembus persalinus]